MVGISDTKKNRIITFLCIMNGKKLCILIENKSANVQLCAQTDPWGLKLALYRNKRKETKSARYPRPGLFQSNSDQFRVMGA